MRKRNWRDVVFGMTVTLLIGALAVPALAATMETKQIEVLSGGIQLVVDGLKVTPKDAKGNEVLPFVFQGTTFVPLRAIGEALGKQVNWDGKTQTVYVGQMPTQSNYLVDICPPYELDSASIYKGTDGDFFTMGGQKYTNGLKLSYHGYALINTNGKYDSMTFTVGHIDGAGMKNATLEVYLDGKFSQSIELNSEAAAREETISLDGALTVKLAVNGSYTSHYGLADIVLN